MASILRARKKGDGAGGGDGRKRLSTVDEGDEAAELAKLAAAEEEVRRLQEEIEAVQAKLDDVEAMREAWMDDPDGVFDSLKPGMRRAYKNADGYFTYLEKERDRLSAKEASLNNRMGGSLHDKGGQANIVAEIKSQKTNVGRFMVSGRLIGSQRFKGVRRYVYSAVSNNAGYAVVTEGDATAHREAIRYEGIDLVFEIVFATHRDASMFTNEVAPTAFGFSSDDIELNPPKVVKFDNIQSIRSWDYRSDDEQDSARCGDSDSTVYTTVEPDGDLAKFQSIELPILLRNGSADCAHLVHKSAVEVEGIDDNDNNRLVLSSTLHRWFDGRRNQHGYARHRFPRFMIEPAPELVDGDYSTVTDSIGEVRERAWVKVSCFEPIDCEVISFNIKEGTQVEKKEGGFVDYLTFVYVLDRDQFYSNLEWKAAETRSVWVDARSRR